MKKRIVLCLLVLALLSVTGCTQKKDAEPLTVTLWHVYGGEVDSPLNGLIKRFNSTVGAKQNIRVKVELVSNSGSIHKSVLAAANGDPGAPSLPDMFVSYPKTVLALPDQDIPVDYRDYFSEEELAAFIPAFREEGMIGGRQAILPLAKSTEVLFVNRTLFDRWAAQSGASYDDLATWEGVYALAERYAADTGKCFFVHDYHFNYFQVGVESLGEDFFRDDGVRFGPGFVCPGGADGRPVAARRVRHGTASHRRCGGVCGILGQRALLFRHGDVSRQHLGKGDDHLHAVPGV